MHGFTLRLPTQKTHFISLPSLLSSRIFKLFSCKFHERSHLISVRYDLRSQLLSLPWRERFNAYRGFSLDILCIYFPRMYAVSQVQRSFGREMRFQVSWDEHEGVEMINCLFISLLLTSLVTLKQKLKRQIEKFVYSAARNYNMQVRCPVKGLDTNMV